MEGQNNTAGTVQAVQDPPDVQETQTLQSQQLVIGALDVVGSAGGELQEVPPQVPPVVAMGSSMLTTPEAGGEDDSPEITEVAGGASAGSMKRSAGSVEAGAGAGLEPPGKKTKRNMSAFMFFSNAYRNMVKEQNPGFLVGDIARRLGELWKDVIPEERAKFEQMALEDKERYERELAENGGAALSKKKDEVVQPYDTVIPLARVKRTVKLDPDVKNISKEATAAIAKATELFLEELAEQSYKISQTSGRRTVKTEDLRLAVNHLQQFEWLRDDFPAAQAASAASTAQAERTPAASAHSITSYLNSPLGTSPAPPVASDLGSASLGSVQTAASGITGGPSGDGGLVDQAAEQTIIEGRS